MAFGNQVWLPLGFASCVFCFLVACFSGLPPGLVSLCTPNGTLTPPKRNGCAFPKRSRTLSLPQKSSRRFPFPKTLYSGRRPESLVVWVGDNPKSEHVALKAHSPRNAERERAERDHGIFVRPQRSKGRAVLRLPKFLRNPKEPRLWMVGIEIGFLARNELPWLKP